MLVVDLSKIDDKDGLDKAKNTAGDKKLGAVIDGRVATSIAGVVSTPDDQSVSYQWGTLGDNAATDDVVETDHFNNISSNAQGVSFTVTTDQIGQKIAVKVTIADDADNGQTGGPLEKDDEVVDTTSQKVEVPPTLSLDVSSNDAASATPTLTANVSEGTRQITFYVNTDATLTTALTTLNLTVAAHKDYGISSTHSVASGTSNVAIEATNASSGLQTIVFNDLTTNVGKRTVTVSLPSAVEGYQIHETRSKLTFTIHDDENTKATGKPTILVRQKAGELGTETDVDSGVAANVTCSKDPNNTPSNLTDDTDCSLGTMAVSGGDVSVGDVLVVDLSKIEDKDGLDAAKGNDKKLGAVIDGRVATTIAGVVSNPDDQSVSYQWGTLGDNAATTGVVETDHFNNISSNAQGVSFTVTTSEIGQKIAVKVTIADDADSDQSAAGGLINKDDEVVDSTSQKVEVSPTLSIAVTTGEPLQILEGGAIKFTVSVDDDLAKDQAVRVAIDRTSVPGNGVDLAAYTDVTIAADTGDTENDSKAVELTTSPTADTQEGKQTVKVSLPSSLKGFKITKDAKGNPQSVTFTVHDSGNSKATGAPGILIVEEAGTATDTNANVKTDKKGTTATTDDTYSLGTMALPKDGISSGTVLVADLAALIDKDGLVNAAGADKNLGAVMTNADTKEKRVQTTSEGVVLKRPSGYDHSAETYGDGIAAIDDEEVTYKWGTLGDDPSTSGVVEKDFFTAITDATAPSYKVTTAEIGKKIAVQVTFSDDGDQEHFTARAADKTDEARTSAGVDILRTLSVSSAVVAEDSKKIKVTVTSDAAVSEDLTVTVGIQCCSTENDVALPATVDVTIKKDQTSGSADVAFTPMTGGQGKRTVTFSLPAVTGYLLDDTEKTAKGTIHDDTNSPIDGMPKILALGKVEQTAGTEVSSGTEDAWARPAGAITDPVNVVPVGTVLVADIRHLTDADGLVNATSTDKMLGVIDADGMVATGETGTPLADPDATNNALKYEWGTVTVESDGTTKFTAFVDTSNPPVANQVAPTYTVVAADLGKMIGVRVKIQDDAYNIAGTPSTVHAETADSSAVDVKVLVSFDKAEYVVQEGGSVNLHLTLSRAAAAGDVVVNLVTDPDTGPLVDDKVPASATLAGVTTGDATTAITYTAPTDGPDGSREFTISIVTTGEDKLPANHVVGKHPSTTVRITDEVNTLVKSGTLTITKDGVAITAATPPVVGDTLTATLSNIVDVDGAPETVDFVWKVGGVGQKTDAGVAYVATGTTSTYTVSSADAVGGQAITVEVTFTDGAGYPEKLTSAATPAIVVPVTDRPDGTAKISRIVPTIRGLTVSGGDTVRLSVDVYGLQDVKDAKLAKDVTFNWSVSPSGGTLPADAKGNSTVVFTAPTSAAIYTVSASLGASDCYDSTAKVGEETAGCTAEFDVRVRRPSAAQPEDPAPVNPPGEIPTILADADGNQYEVFTPVEGGSFDSGEGYSIAAASGAVPNGEFIGVRMSDEGVASNAGMTHQRYTLGGNMYAVSAVDETGTAITSAVLDDPATVCVPLPNELRSNISKLAVVAINSDDSLTILSAQVKITATGAMVCGGLSELPASVAVGSSGAPAAIPTATPEPTPEPPDTGGTAPASSGNVLWALLLGVATLALGTTLVIARRREGTRKS